MSKLISLLSVVAFMVVAGFSAPLADPSANVATTSQISFITAALHFLL